MGPRGLRKSFLCDAMLGGLAKWLRAAGYDAYYAREGTDVSDRSLARKALDEGRVLLSSDRGFLERKPVREGRLDLLVVPARPVEDQLRLVAESYDLERHPARCMGCNGVLAVVAPDTVVERVPPKVFQAHDLFFRCQSCDRVFWHGSHWERIEGRLERVFECQESR